MPVDEERPRPLPEELKYLGFGIPSLDRLIGQHQDSDDGEPARRAQCGYKLYSNVNNPAESTTFCIVGPDGTGKSLFALHLVSDYWRRTSDCEKPPKIIYATTDLSFERADTVWKSFWLHRPFSRYQRLPFEKEWLGTRDVSKPNGVADPRTWETCERNDTRPEGSLRLYRYHPTESFADFRDPFADYLVAEVGQHKEEDGCPRGKIAFLDLEAATSGDDWEFLHKLLAVLEEPSAGAPRHLLVIDAVEGLETLVGERDAFGELQSRRARIARIVREATDKCHLVFVVEEPRDGSRLPEVFVADLVMRLRAQLDRDYLRRTVELEKVRGQPHVRGQHDFRVIQKSSKTGEEINADAPWVGSPDFFMAYMQVFPSLHHLTRIVRSDSRRDDSTWKANDWRCASFGIYHLDAMLWKSREPEFKTRDLPPENLELGNRDVVSRLEYDMEAWQSNHQTGRPACLADGRQAAAWRRLREVRGETLPRGIAGFDQAGLPAGSITTLIGNDSTYKQRLARSFLAQAFRVRHVLREEYAYLPVVAANDRDPLLKGQGVAILLATYDTDKVRLAEMLKCHLIAVPGQHPGPEDLQDKGMKERLLVRHLDPHHMPPAEFVHLVHQYVQEAKRRLAGMVTDRKAFGRIRLVIDDWSTILATYPEVGRDPLVLPYLINYLRQEGITSLILATRSGNLSDRPTSEVEQEIRELRTMADHHLFTWHVSFFDGRRVAIAMQPSPDPDSGLVIRELRPGRRSELPKNRLGGQTPAFGITVTQREADHVAEQFDDEGLIVDPHFELYSGVQDGKLTQVALDVRLYAEREDAPGFQGYLEDIRYLFQHLFGRSPDHVTIQAECGAQYDRLRPVTYFQSATQLERTLVLQVDEFWAETHAYLRPQETYLFARTVDRDNTPIRTNDPFELFGPTDELRKRLKAKQKELYRESSQGIPLRRIDCFDTIAYDCDEARKRFVIEKVPYAWDFGFLICNEIAWERAFLDQDRRTARVRPNPHGNGHGYDVDDQLVGQIWYRLWRCCPLEAPAHRFQSEWLLNPDLRDKLPKKPPASWEPALSDHFTSIRRLPVTHYSYYGLTVYTENPNESKKEDKPKREDELLIQPRLTHLPPTDLDPEAVLEDTAEEKKKRLERFRNDPDRQRSEQQRLETDDQEWEEMRQKKRKWVEGFRQGRHMLSQEHPDPVGWREFLGACKLVAHVTKSEFVPFDIELMAPESFSCLVLEMVFSEIQQSLNAAKEWGPVDPNMVEKLHPRKKREEAYAASLKEMFGKDEESGQLFRRALYRVFLLLDEITSKDQLTDRGFVLESRPAKPNAVAARHWYSTASLALSGGPECRGKVLVGLPGHYSVRGDWFLGVAKTSRSARLGERAMDILCSRRANITRLQNGLGLPVRDLFGTDASSAALQRRGEYRTSLPYVGDDLVQQLVPYKELRKLGAFDPKDCLGRAGNFFWLFRSTIRHYDIHCRVFSRWLVSLLNKWRQWRTPVAPADSKAQPHLEKGQEGKPWQDGFCEYDFYLKQEYAAGCQTLVHVTEKGNSRWQYFTELCDGLVEALGRVATGEQEQVNR